MKHLIAIGDWSDDGHGKHDDLIVEIPDEFTQEILGNQFRANVESIGFGPHQFAHNYEDGKLPVDKLKVLVEAGFDLTLLGEDKEDYGLEGGIWLNAEDMLRIVMFYFGHGLEGFSYQYIKPETPPALIGYWSKVTAGIEDRGPYGVSVGYGIYA